MVEVASNLVHLSQEILHLQTALSEMFDPSQEIAPLSTLFS